jgi:hypothetical protein
MKFFTNKTTLAALALATLAACGGGGAGSSSTSPVVTTYTAATACASGPALTSTVSQAAADALVPAACPALTSAQLSAIAVNRSATGALTLTGLPTGVAWSAKSVTFTKGSTSVTGTVDAAGNITPTSALAAGTWTVTFTGQPALAPAVTNLTLASVVVPAAATPLTTRLTAQGTLVTTAVSGMNTVSLPIGELVGGPNWNAAITANNANASTGISQTRLGVVIGTRAINMTVFTDPVGGASCMHPVYADDGSSAYGVGATAKYSCYTSPFVTYKGEADGFAVKNAAGTCTKLLHNGTNWVGGYRTAPTGNTTVAPGDCGGL